MKKSIFICLILLFLISSLFSYSRAVPSKEFFSIEITGLFVKEYEYINEIINFIEEMGFSDKTISEGTGGLPFKYSGKFKTISWYNLNGNDNFQLSIHFYVKRRNILLNFRITQDFETKYLINDEEHKECREKYKKIFINYFRENFRYITLSYIEEYKSKIKSKHRK